MNRRYRAPLRFLVLAIALSLLAACGDDDDGHRRVATGTATPAPTATPTAAPCPFGLPFCGGDFPLNTQMTTPFGPAWADVNTASTEFLPCFGPYALCFYANCTTQDDGTSICPCFEWYGTNYVLITGILNADSYQSTISACGSTGANCQTPNTAPVCADINNGTYLSGAKVISTFALYRSAQEPLGSTDCSSQPDRSPYAGCMTSPCFGPTMPGPDPHTVSINCDCPLYDGPYQIGLNLDPSACDDAPMAWSASFRPSPTPGTGPTPTPRSGCGLVQGCVPDAPADECGCPLYVPGQTAFPPGSNINCDTVCQEYNTCVRGENNAQIQLGYTCDATLCTSHDHDLVFDACIGLEKCSLGEIFRAEEAAQCSCCASQLCHCAANTETDYKVYGLDASQRSLGETPQCDINDTLCGTPPP